MTDITGVYDMHHAGKRLLGLGAQRTWVSEMIPIFSTEPVTLDAIGTTLASTPCCKTAQAS